MSRQTDPSDQSNIRQEAAEWVARLQRPGRNPEADSIALRQWTEMSCDHAASLAEATQVWEELQGAGKIFQNAERKRKRQWLRTAGCVTALAACLVIAVVDYRGASAAYATPVGGQQQVTLADGSLVFLDSNSRVTVRYTRRTRLVTLEQGSAYFKVAKNAARPFIVNTKYSTTKALGTAFLVQNSPGLASTILVEGQVVVTAHKTAFENSQSRPVVLYPGQRWISDDRHVYNLSKIAMEKALAWQSGRLLFDDERLGDAVAEFNRYSSIPIVIETENAARVRVSGIFNIHDEQSFTSAVSELYGLSVVPLRNSIVIAGTPKVKYNEAITQSKNYPVPDVGRRE